MPIPFTAKSHPLNHQWPRQALEDSRQRGLKLYLVGGYVRDAMLERDNGGSTVKDFDFAVVGGSAVEFAQYFATTHGGHFVLLDRNLDTARVVAEDATVLDFAGCMGATIEQDIRRRDFTVNALAWDADNPDQIIDLVGGVEDLKNKVVRAISEQAFIDDPLRVLRAFRFAAALAAPIESGTEEMIRRHAPQLKNIAGERISYEWFTTMNAKKVGDLVKQMGAAGVLEAVFPELELQHQVTPNAYHHLGLFDHSMEAVTQSELFLEHAPDFVHQSLSRFDSHAVTRRAATKTACLLHDIGKPATWEITGEGRHTFIGHDKLGAEMNDAVAKRLKWSRPIERLITGLIRDHLRPGQLYHQGPPTDKAIHRFYRNVGEDVTELIVLAFGDLGATRGPGLEESRGALEKSLGELLRGYPVFIDSQKKQPKLLDGSQVMQLLGIKPGPAVGELLDELEEAQGLKQVADRQEAERFIAERYREKYPG
jgi:putative nucleotidyltransferase with HDIG domain